LDETIYKYNNLGKYAGIYILAPLVAALFGGFLASIF
jgi:hypothetical protein